MTTSVSQQIIESGMVEIAFKDALRASVDEHVFQIHRDHRDWLWLVATRDGGAQLSLLHEPPASTGRSGEVLSSSQWALANNLAIDSITDN